MKQILIIFAFICTTLFTQAQDKLELNKHDAKQEYCMIVLTTQELLSNKMSISVDFGQAWSLWKESRTLNDESGKRREFNSIIDALNYMSSQGWEYVNAYSLTVGEQNKVHYVMKRELSEKVRIVE